MNGGLGYGEKVWKVKSREGEDLLFFVLQGWPDLTRRKLLALCGKVDMRPLTPISVVEACMPTYMIYSNLDKNASETTAVGSRIH